MTKWFKIEYTLHSAHEHILASKQTENLFFEKLSIRYLNLEYLSDSLKFIYQKKGSWGPKFRDFS